MSTATISGDQLLNDFGPRQKAGELHLARMERTPKGRWEVQYYLTQPGIKFEHMAETPRRGTVAEAKTEKATPSIGHAGIGKENPAVLNAPVPAGTPPPESISDESEMPDFPDIPDEINLPAPQCSNGTSQSRPFPAGHNEQGTGAVGVGGIAEKQNACAEIGRGQTNHAADHVLPPPEPLTSPLVPPVGRVVATLECPICTTTFPADGVCPICTQFARIAEFARLNRRDYAIKMENRRVDKDIEPF